MKPLKVLTNPQEIHLLFFFISCFTISVTPTINIPESFNDFMIIIISFISSFEKNKVNSFPTVTAPFPLILLSNLFIVFDFELLTNPGKLSLAKGIAISVSAFFPNLPYLNYVRYLSFTKFYIC